VRAGNPKSEYRNPKQIPMIGKEGKPEAVRSTSFVHSIFSNLFRISDFEFRISGVRTSPFWLPGFAAL
jgi:hypothetical protein